MANAMASNSVRSPFRAEIPSEWESEREQDKFSTAEIRSAVKEELDFTRVCFT